MERIAENLEVGSMIRWSVRSQSGMLLACGAHPSIGCRLVSLEKLFLTPCRYGCFVPDHDKVKWDKLASCASRVIESFRGIPPYEFVCVSVSSPLYGEQNVELSAQSALLRLVPHFLGDVLPLNCFPLLEVSFSVSNEPFIQDGWLINELRVFYLGWVVFSGGGRGEFESALTQIYRVKLEMLTQILALCRMRGGGDSLAVINGFSVAIMSLEKVLSGKFSGYCEKHFIR